MASSFILPVSVPSQERYSIDTLIRFATLTRADYQALAGAPQGPLDLTRPIKTWVDPAYIAAFKAGPASAAYQSLVPYSYFDYGSKTIQQFQIKAGEAGSPNIPLGSWTMDSGLVYLGDDGKTEDKLGSVNTPIRDLVAGESISTQNIGTVPFVENANFAPAPTPATGSGGFTDADRTAIATLTGLAQQIVAKLPELDSVYQAVPFILAGLPNSTSNTSSSSGS
jgi:hypothetical protein